MSKSHAAEFKGIENVIVSGRVGEDNEISKINERALGQLFSAGFKTKNSNGEIDFNLTNLEERIVKAADGFLFLPIPTEMEHPKADEKRKLFREIFKAASLFVGAQTKDEHMRLDHNPELPLKPIVLVNHNGCWDPFLKLIDNMHRLGTITQKPETIITAVDSVPKAIDILKKAHEQKAVASHGMVHTPHHALRTEPADRDPKVEHKPEFNVCVFCSASTKNPELLNSAKEIGAGIASEGWGVISGLGSSGMMGKVVEGASEVIKKEGHGWIGGSNLPRIIHIEGLPEYYDKNWVREDIYTRMEVMIKESQAMIAMPGGMGTVQELMAMLLLKHNKEQGQPYIMRDERFGNKPIILVNQKINDSEGHAVNFWQPVVEMAKQFGFEKDFIVVDTVEEAMDRLRLHRYRKGDPAPAMPG